jgi:magnesium-transporting ATPase (P-type)
LIKTSSPDELALVNFAKYCGYEFKGVDRDDHYLIDFEGSVQKFKLLHVLEFNSKRKRMSVILRKDDEILLLTKGADSVIAKRLAASQEEDLKTAFLSLEDYGKEGLRTLMLAQRIVPQEEYEKWVVQYNKALASMVNREESVEAQQDLIEVELELVGCTAIEDRLQDEVPETIDLLLKANIKLWVLTGDKGNLYMTKWKLP